MPLLSLVSLAGWCLFLSAVSGWALEAVPLFAVSALIAALYAGALAGQLVPVVKVLAWSGIILAGVFLFLAAARRKDLYARFQSPGFLLFLAAGVAAYFKFRGGAFLDWDAFSHWGLVIKDMFHSGGLPSLAGAVEFKDYPPGATLFHYFMAYLPGYSEGGAFFSHSVMLLSCACAFTPGFSGRAGARGYAAFLLACVLVPVFGFSYKTVMVDSLIGLFACAAAAGYILSEGSKLQAALRAVPVLLVIPLFKPVGLILSLLAGAIIAQDLLRSGTLRDAAQVSGRSAALPLLLAVFLLFAAPLVSHYSWNSHVRNLGLSQTFNTSLPANSLIKSFLPGAPARDKATIKNFASALFLKGVGIPKIPAMAWGLLFLGLAVYLSRRLAPPMRSYLFASQVVMAAGFVVYSFGLLFLYLRSFSDYEGIKLASYSRYMGLYLLAWAGSLAGIGVLHLRTISAWPSVRPVHAMSGLAAGLIVWTLVPPGGKGMEVREKVAAAVAPAKAIVRPGEKVYLLWQNTNGYEYWISRYEIAPAISMRDAFSLGRKYDERDVWTQDIGVKAWGEKLAAYDYLLVGAADDPFWDRYGGMFGGASKACGAGLYRVKKEAGRVLLECVKPGGST